jgi:hypothetical protein
MGGTDMGTADPLTIVLRTTAVTIAATAVDTAIIRLLMAAAGVTAMEVAMAAVVTAMGVDTAAMAGAITIKTFRGTALP